MTTIMDLGPHKTILIMVLGSLSLKHPKGPCTQIVYTLAPKYLYRDYLSANVYTIWVHGPLGTLSRDSGFGLRCQVSSKFFRNRKPKTALVPGWGSKF